jgi:hypothetical protein
MKSLTFAFDVEINDTQYIPEGTKVEVYPTSFPKEDSTKIIYNNEIIEFMNVSFKELR